jgi:hypothetical protein
MIPEKPAPDVIRSGNRFSKKIMREQKARTFLNFMAFNFMEF